MRRKNVFFATCILSLLFFNSNAQISGVAYRDYNGNGSRETSGATIEPGVGNVTVNVYNRNEVLVGTTTTAASGASVGTYSFTGLSLPVRVEFIIPSGTGCLNSATDYATVGGDGDRARFVNASTSTLNFGLNNPADHVGSINPLVFAPRYVNGNPLGGGSAGTQTWFVGYPYNSTGTGAPTLTLNGTVIGATWGVAYSKQAKKVFASAFMKRHCGFGVLGSGGIYQLTPTATSFNVVQFFDMDAPASLAIGSGRTRADATAPSYGAGSSYSLSTGGLQVTYLGANDPATGEPSGLGVIGSNTDRGLPAGNTGNYDAAAFDQVGKVSMGDLEISDDGRFLFVVNLYDKKIYRLELNDAYNPTSVTAVTSYALPSISVTNGVVRPFALKYYRNKLMVGALSTGENGGVNNVGGSTDMYSYVFELNDPTGSPAFTVSPVLAYPLNYLKGASRLDQAGANRGEKWNPWTNNSSSYLPLNSGYGTYPTPLLSNIDFNDRGDMIMSFSDRSGHQWGWANRANLSTSASNVNFIVGGDLLIAGEPCTGGSFTLENNGIFSSFGVTYTGGTGNSQGPGGGEFFNQEFINPYHAEIHQGALAVLPGNQYVLTSTMDPISINTGGTVKFSINDGSKADPYQFYGTANGAFGKANGIGDIELAGTEAPIEIGNRVWDDANGDGIQNAGEGGIAGVVLELLDNSGNPIDGDTTTAGVQPALVETDANGNWYFSTRAGTSTTGTNFNVAILPNTTYRVRIATSGAGNDWDPAANSGNGGPRSGGDLEGYTLTLTGVNGGGAPDLSDNDAVIVSGIPEITLTTGNYGQCELDNDFGFKPLLGSIGDKVWNDTNGDGTQDAGELGLAGITVVLYDNSNNIIATTRTDGLGNYLFSNLSLNGGTAEYQVRFYTAPGYVFAPQNGAATLTDNSDADQTNGRTALITLTFATPDVTYVDAGLVATTPTIIGDFIWNDLNGDGIQDPGEPGIAGVTVTLYDAAGNVIRTTVTDNNGHYQFIDVPAGTYSLGVTPPVGFIGSPSGQGGDTGADSDFDPSSFRTPTFTVSNGVSDLTKDCGLVKQPATVASIGDKVWNDINGNGLQDNGETGVAGVTVELFDATNTIIATVTTDVLGNYIFNNVTPGDYYIKFSNLPVGYTLATANSGGDDLIDSDVDGSNGAGTTATYTILAGQTNVSIDCGLTPPANTYSIGDKVWYDLDKDGIQDAASSGEVGVPGVTVILFSAGVAVDSTMTDANGNYQFSGLAAGTYNIGFTGLPSGYGFTSVNADAAGLTGTANSDVNPNTGITAAIVVGANIDYIDAGLVAVPDDHQNTMGSIGDKVWNDIDNDGIQDPGEPGVLGVIVTLYAADGVTVIATDTTNAFGNYSFNNLPSGSYVIGFSNLPSGFVFSTPGQGTDPNKDSDADATTGKTGTFILQPGQANASVDAGIYNPAGSSIGDFVWFDVNSNGIQDAGEPGVPGVSVTLYDDNGVVVATTVTDNNGNYLFTGLAAGDYQLGFSNLPSGFTATVKDAGGSTAANGSDAEAGTLRTDVFTLAASSSNTDIDMGIVPVAGVGAIGDYVWFDANGNGIQDAGESPAAGILVTLYDNTSTAIATAVTDGDGHYLFVNIPVAGGGSDYTLNFSNLPAGSGFTLAGAGTAANNSDVDASGNVTVTLTPANAIRTDIDAGIASNFSSIGDYVWYDLNGDGIQDANEPGVPGIVVTLYSTGGDNQPGGGDDVLVASAVTDGSGHYFINNIPVNTCGNFFVQFSSIAGNPFTIQNTGGSAAADNSKADATGQTDVFQLCPGEVNSAVDAGVTNPPLPVQKIDVYASLQGGVASIKWITENEINTGKFIVERSVDHINFVAAGQLAAGGNVSGSRSYFLNDDISNIRTSVVYYRIKVVDIDGRFKYSSIVAVRIAPSNKVTIWPVPFADKLTVALNSSLAQPLRVSLLDLSGRTISTGMYAVTRGNNQFDLNNLGKLANGMYIVKITNSDGETIHTQKVLKQ